MKICLVEIYGMLGFVYYWKKNYMNENISGGNFLLLLTRF